MEGSMAAVASRIKAIPGPILILAGLLAAPAAMASTLPAESAGHDGALQVRFNPAVQETIVASRVTPRLCFALSLPEEWRQNTGSGETSVTAVSSTAELDVNLRSARELQDQPQPDLAHRDATFLQQDYEALLGRPAQSVSLTSPAPGATRWSATWIDRNLPSDSHVVTIEALIVPLSNEWVLELSLSGIDTPQAHEALVARVLSGLKVNAGAACRD
jgi:hypothetical protein